MSNSLNNVLIFAAGALIGSAVTYKLLRTKFEKIANEEIESVKEMYRGMQCDEVEEEDPELVKKKEELAELEKYRKVLAESKYKNESINEEEEEYDVDKPYVIEPEEYGEKEDYDTESLWYYSDGVLADDMNNIVEDVESLVGSESLNSFGRYEDDAVHVRNDRLKTDYEILRDNASYSDTKARTYPHRMEEE